MHVLQELLEGAVQHRATPHHRLVVIEEEPDRHQTHVVRNGRHDHLVDDDRLLVDAEHVRDRMAVDVRVEHADLAALRGERGSEVDRQCRLADSALAGGDRDHARLRRELDAARFGPAAQLGRQRRTFVGRHHVEVERHRSDAGQRPDVLADLILEARAKGAPDDGQGNRHAHVCAVDLDRAHHVQLGDRAPELRVDHIAERLEDLVAREHVARVAERVNAATPFRGCRRALIAAIIVV